MLSAAIIAAHVPIQAQQMNETSALVRSDPLVLSRIDPSGVFDYGNAEWS